MLGFELSNLAFSSRLHFNLPCLLHSLLGGDGGFEGCISEILQDLVQECIFFLLLFGLGVGFLGYSAGSIQP